MSFAKITTVQNNMVSVSVIVPCYNEERWISQVLNALENQSYPRKDLEIIVVDNGSADATREIVKKYNVKLLIENKRSSYRARNLGINHSTGEYIALLDADCIPNQDWVLELVKYSKENDVLYIGGRIENNLVIHNFANKLLCSQRTAEKRKESVLRDKCVPGGNILIHKSIFQKCSMFTNSISGADAEFSRRAFKNGIKIGYAEKAIVFHQSDLSNIDYLRRSFRIRYGQENNSGTQRSPREIFRTIARVPWRPGFNDSTIKNMMKQDVRKDILSLWLFIYINRWSSYFGGVYGVFTRSK